MFASAPWAKSKVDLYTISSDGKQFYGVMHLPGTALMKSDSKIDHNKMMFLSCHDCGYCAWYSCAIAYNKIHMAKGGDLIQCKFALMIGIVYTEDDDTLYCHCLLWSDIGCFSNITEGFCH